LDLINLFNTIEYILLIFYYQLNFILEIIILLFDILSVALVVIMLTLIILYITIYKYKKLKLILTPSIEILEDWYLYGY
jgi:hypothetical protein